MPYFHHPASVYQIKSLVSFPEITPSSDKYVQLVNAIRATCHNIPKHITDSLWEYVKLISKSEIDNHFSAPMFWIGIYIALASAVCILAMMADLLHGFRSRKLWFPCTYFRLNAAFFTIISVAMKLPVDLTGSMMGEVDKAAKLGSMAFMCVIMANLLPCLAIMGNTELLSNVIALCILVITLVVNVCIQIQTGVLATYTSSDYRYSAPVVMVSTEINMVASIYVALLLMLLIAHVSSSVAILESKKIIESRYQKGRDMASKETQSKSGELLTVDKLQKHVSNHWIMAGSGSPQFITTCFYTTSASGVICLLATTLHTFIMFVINFDGFFKGYDSDYGSSMSVILIVQYIGSVIGTIAPLSRCFATLSFKVSSKIISNRFKVYKVESYWTQKFYDWKEARIRLSFCSDNLEVVIETLKRLIFNTCIGLQNGVVVFSKVIALIPFLFMICFLYCFRCIKWLLIELFPSLGNKFEELREINDLRPYVLQLEDDIELGDRTLKGLLKSVNRLIQKGAKIQPKNLKNLILEKSTSDFEGVKKFDHIDDHDVPCVDCWRLQVVTLTTIIISLTKIEKGEVDSFLESVKEGLEYVIVVEKSLNAKNDHVSFQKAADTLWQEIRFHNKWLRNQLHDPAFQVDTPRPIIEWFRNKARNIISSEAISKDNFGGENDDTRHKTICANSMYRITETILLNYHINIDSMASQKELFDSLSSIIADIIVACLTNLPQAILVKCHTNVIEEREDSVYDAAQLLGETTQIIETLLGRNIPNMDPCDLPFIEKWRVYLGNP